MALIQRTESKYLNSILGLSFPVAGNGFIRVIDYMGDDSSVVQAARISYGAGTTKVSDDRKLIRTLMREHHTSPFEMVELKIHVRAAMDVWRQWIRHRTANVNEYSTRYSLAIDDSAYVLSDQWRLQSMVNKQGSDGLLAMEAGKELSQAQLKLQEDAKRVYERRLQLGVAREQARMDLPLSTMTEAYWKIDLHNLLHFLTLRMASNAQQEIRVYAEKIAEEIVAPWCPFTWEAYEDYRHHAYHFSRTEAQLLGLLLPSNIPGVVRAKAEKLLVGRELTQFLDKLQRMQGHGPEPTET